MMQIGVIGMSHKTASLYTREALAQVCANLFDPKLTLIPEGSFVPLSTCNRIEIYFSSKDLAKTHSWILQRLRSMLKPEFDFHLYAYFGREAFEHLGRVVSGVDSALLGESEIQGQVKRAYLDAQQFAFLNRELHYLFQKGLKIGKSIRSSLLDCHPKKPLAKIIWSRIQKVFPEMKNLKILFVGFSRMNLSLFEAMKGREVDITFLNRTYSKMENFIQKNKIKSLLWSEKKKWPLFDVAIFGTHAGRYIAHPSDLKRVSGRSWLVFDLSVPRNVDPNLSFFKGMNLYNLEQLHSEIEREFQEEGRKWQSLAEQRIQMHVERYIRCYETKIQHVLGSAEKELHHEYSPFLS